MSRLPRPAFLVLFVAALLVIAAPATAKGPVPDLVVGKVSKPPVTQVVGSKLKLAVKVANKGGRKAGKSKLAIYLAKGKKHGKKDKLLKRTKVKPLKAHKSKKLKVQLTLPAKTAPGSYRLILCADDKRQVREIKEKDNCRSTRKLTVVAKPVPAPAPPPAAAFSMTDGIDWGFVEDANQQDVEAGDQVTVALRVGNGLPGQAGYSRSAVASEPFRSGNTSALSFSGSNNSEDDGQVTVPLPFAFPFGGVKETSVSVSTNGWVSFGSPAWDYWDDAQPDDYRGIPFVVGELERGIMPYWDDLDVREQGAGTGTVKEVVAPDNSWVAFQWDLGQHSSGIPRRTFQVVLFPDGRFRLDYPGENAPGGNEAMVGYSLGTGPASADVVAANTESVPASGFLYTPNAVTGAGPTQAGSVSLTLPKGSSFISGSAGCAVSTAPGATNPGLVTCPIGPIAAGQQTAPVVTYSAPGDAPGLDSPENWREVGTYSAGSVNLVDGDEIDTLNTGLPSTTLKVNVEYTGGNLEGGVPTTFRVEVEPKSGALDMPTLNLATKNGTVTAVKSAGDPLDCALPGSNVNCQLPSGSSTTVADVTFVPTTTGVVELKATAQALNAPPASYGIGLAP